jgi:hypothetical protein
MSAPHSPRFEELIPAYALGALDGDDLREMEEHLTTDCAECRRQLDLWQGDLEALAVSVTPVAPSAQTRERILRVAGGPPRRWSPPGWLLLPVAALLLLAVWGVAGQVRLRGEVERLAAERDRLEDRVASLDRQVRRTSEALRLIASPGVQSVVLAGLGPSPGAAGQTYVNPGEGSALFYAFDLPALAPDKTYQLWVIQGGKPISAGVFAVDPSGQATVRVDNLGQIADTDVWAVTVEPQGGVPQPTGEMVLKG